MYSQANAIHLPFADAVFHAVVTSPPYFGLRSYGAGNGEIGLETTPEAYITNMVAVFREVRRCLRDDGVCFLNLGDSYASGGIGRRDTQGEYAERRAALYGSGRGNYNGPHEYRQRDIPAGYKPKDLLCIPWRVALALQADGWWLRSAAPWIKPNAMPESVQDRPSSAVEYIFMLTKAPHYFYDADAVRKQDAGLLGGRQRAAERGTFEYADKKYKINRVSGGQNGLNKSEYTGLRNRRNSDPYYDALDDQIAALRGELARLEAARRNGGVLTDADGDVLALNIPSQPTSLAHFATFPPKLIEPLIKAATSERGCCPACGAQWERVVERESHYAQRESAHVPNNCASKVDSTGWKPPTANHTGWRATCTCNAGDPVPAVVFDPFCGAGTTMLTARNLGRRSVGVDLSYTYLHEIAARRTSLDFGAAEPIPENEDMGPLFAR